MARLIANNDLQAAVYTAISALDYDVYDFIPEKKEYPYIVISGNYSNSEGDTKTSYGRSITQTIDIWTAYKGKLQAQTIAAAVVALFGRNLSISNFTVVDAKHSATFEQATGETRATWRGIVELEFYLRQS